MHSKTLLVLALVSLAIPTGLAVMPAPAVETAPTSGPAPAGGADDGETVATSHHALTTAPEVDIAFTVFRPVNATAAGATVPLVLDSHGWGGSRTTEASGDVAQLLDAGYGVLSFDARGHGDSTGYATIHHKDHEVLDTIQLIDWAYDTLDWVTKEGDAEEKDLLLGAIGGSYGGGYQLMAASYDSRLDAIVPQMTWNDLRYSLGPNGYLKSTWVDALVGFAVQGNNAHPDIYQWWLDAKATNDLPQAALDHLEGSSPVAEDITAATLLVQGLPDALFNLNEAWHNYVAIRGDDQGDNVALVGYLGGHVLPYPGQPVGAVGPERGSEPCGAYADLAEAWFDAHLKDLDVDQAQGITLPLEEDGECVSFAEPEDLVTEDFGFDVLPAPNGAGTILVPVDAPTGVIAGLPHLAATMTVATDSRFSVGLAVLDEAGNLRIVDDQAAFQRVQPEPGQTSVEIDLEMTGVATRLADGDQLILRIDGLHEWATTSSGRTPGGGLFTDVTLTLPYVPGA